jgi:ubiquinone/menaquinone biosynthesis C-methylase UbiE
MDRVDWIREKKRVALERMDTLSAPNYDERWGAISATHAVFINRFLDRLPAGGLVLDAACGTGKYWPLVLASGRQVEGIDQSGGMLRQARQKFPQVPVKQISLQELDGQESFDGILCIDAMESIFPEDWPQVLSRLQRALKPGGVFYLTVEQLPAEEIAAAWAAGQALGLPLVYGEWAPEGRYHFYPGVEQVKTWLEKTGFRLVAETFEDEYQHLIVQK